MSIVAEKVLAAFESLPAQEQQAVAKEIFRRTSSSWRNSLAARAVSRWKQRLSDSSSRSRGVAAIPASIIL